MTNEISTHRKQAWDTFTLRGVTNECLVFRSEDDWLTVNLINGSGYGTIDINFEFSIEELIEMSDYFQEAYVTDGTRIHKLARGMQAERFSFYV